MRRRPGIETLLWIGAAAAVTALIGAFGMISDPGSDVLGNAGRPEGWFGMLLAAAALLFLLVYRGYRKQRALKFAAAGGIGALAFGLLAAVTLPPDCGALTAENRPLACLDVYAKDPGAAGGGHTWGIWLLSIGGLIVAGAAILALFELAGGAGERRPLP